MGSLARLPVLVLVGCALALASRAGAQDFDVRLRTRTLSAPTHDQALIDALRRPGVRRVHGILRFQAPLSRATHLELDRRGVVLLEFLEHNAYVASIPATIQPRALPALRGSDLLRVEDKVDAPLLQPPRPPFLPIWALVGRGPRVKATVEFHEDVTSGELQGVFRRFPDGVFSELGGEIWSLVIPGRRVRALAEEDAVKRIHLGPGPPLPLVPWQRKSIGTEVLQGANFGAPAPKYAVDGNPIRVGIFDEGVGVLQQGGAGLHADLLRVQTNGLTANVSRVVPARPASWHGLRVASIAGGSGYRSVFESLTPFKNRGHAPSVQLGDYPKYRADYNGFHRALVRDEMSVTNHSYMQSATEYDFIARATDKIIRGDAVWQGDPIPARPEVWAAGNNGEEPMYPYDGGTEAGYHSVHTTAKNSISVGSVDAPHHGLTPMSSLGPTFDGRIKPDVVAPGCIQPSGIQAAEIGTAGYLGGCGTSFAAPAVTGAIALMMHKTYGAPKLSPAAYRAALIQTAEDLDEVVPNPESMPIANGDTGQQVVFHEGPDFATGWGLVDAVSAAGLVRDTSRWRHGEIGYHGDYDLWCVAVPLFASEIKLTLAWDDLPGSTLTAPEVSRLVNDLDLRLISPVGDVVEPWTMELLPLQPKPGQLPDEIFTAADVVPAHRAADRRNNVEVASWRSPRRGKWRVLVLGHQLPKWQGQAYSLASSHEFGECE